MTQVFVRKAAYDPPLIRALVDDMLDSMGPDFIRPGSRVLIKPNLLLPAAPDKAIVTHPMICRAVVQYVLNKGAQVQVSDSPGMGTFRKLVRETGYADALDDLDVVFKPFEASVEVDIGPPFGRIPIAREAVEADLVINLAKLKTHAQMYLTLAVKNIFGCIVGLRKPEWHMRAGVDRMLFAQLIVQIYQAVSPGFTVVDGILALEGQGPGKSGTPRQLGLIVAGDDGYAVDKTICTLLGLEPDRLLTCHQARALNLFNGEVRVNGDLRIVDDFVFPQLHSMSLDRKSVV